MPQAPRDYIDLQVPPSIFMLPYHISFIIDGVVENIMHLNEELGTLFLSNPTITLIDSDLDLGQFQIEISSGDSIETMTFDERTSAVLLANPLIKQVPLTSDNGPDLGWLYNSNTDTFTQPE